MVDTVRTLEAIQNLLADNTAGNISAQDMRDAIISLWVSSIPAWSDVTHVKGQLIRRPDGRIYEANDPIPAGTGFIIGTTGATWVLVIDGSNSFPNVTAGSLLTVDATGVPEASSLSETTERVRSTKEFQVPGGGGGVILSNLDISGQGLIIGIRDRASNRMFLPIATELTTPGTQRPVDLGLGAVTTVVSQPTETIPIAAATNEVQFSVLNTNAGTAINFSLRRPAAAAAASNCNLIVRLNSHSDPNPILDYKRDQPQSQGFTLTGENPTITFPAPAFFTAATVLYITIVSDASDNLDLLGGNVDLGAGTQNIPAGTIQGRFSTPLPLAYQSETFNTEQIQDIVAAMFTGGTHNGITFAYDDTDGFIDATVTGTTPPASADGAVSAFSINVPSTVNVGTDLNNARQITYTVSNVSDIATLNLVVTVGTDIALTVPSVDGTLTQNVTLAGISTAVAGTVTFQIRGTRTGGQVIMSNTVTTTIRAITPDEQAYYGVRPTNDFVTVATSELTAVDVQPAGSTYTISGSWPATQYVGILEPTDRPITSIVETAFNQETLNTWTRTASARTISGQAYDLLVQQNNGPTGTFEFRVTHG